MPNSAIEPSPTKTRRSIRAKDVKAVDISSMPSLHVAKASNPLSEQTLGACAMQLRDDRVLVRLIDEPSIILLTDKPKSIKGIVLAVGPGKWVPGTWWHFLTGERWRWIDGHREPVTVKPGQIVAFNSRWNDLTHAENKGTGADGKGKLERPLSYKLDQNVHLIREADIFGILPNEHVRVEYLRTGMEELFVNRSIA